MKNTKKIAAIAVLAAASLSLAACGNEASETTTTAEAVPSNEYPQTANPWHDVDDLDAAKEEAGFEMSVPESIEGYYLSEYRVTDEGDKIIEVIFTESDSDIEIRLRKGEGSEDISGDYNDYAYSSEINSGKSYTVKGDSENVLKLAVWTDGNFTYSVTSDNGLTSEIFNEIVNSVE